MGRVTNYGDFERSEKSISSLTSEDCHSERSEEPNVTASRQKIKVYLCPHE